VDWLQCLPLAPFFPLLLGFAATTGARATDRAAAEGAAAARAASEGSGVHAAAGGAEHGVGVFLGQPDRFLSNLFFCHDYILTIFHQCYCK
jgi:hypothetical protein